MAASCRRLTTHSWGYESTSTIFISSVPNRTVSPRNTATTFPQARFETQPRPFPPVPRVRLSTQPLNAPTLRVSSPLLFHRPLRAPRCQCMGETKRRHQGMDGSKRRRAMEELERLLSCVLAQAVQKIYVYRATLTLQTTRATPCITPALLEHQHLSHPDISLSCHPRHHLPLHCPIFSQRPVSSAAAALILPTANIKISGFQSTSHPTPSLPSCPKWNANIGTRN